MSNLRDLGRIKMLDPLGSLYNFAKLIVAIRRYYNGELLMEAWSHARQFTGK